MNATISMDSLWTIIDSLSIKNKKWLAEKLHASLTTIPRASEEKEILSGIDRSIKEVKAGKTYSLDTLWDQL